MMEGNYPPTLVQMGNLLFEAGNLDKAEKYYAKALKID
jgi:tetratricopeptide (TPR) repeat protein